MSAPDPLDEWYGTLDIYEGEYAEHLTRELAWYSELIRELLRCRGVEQLSLLTSHLHLSLGTRNGGSINLDLDRSTGEYLVHWRRPSGRTEVRRCPHLKSVVRAIRVAARQCGVKISQPPRVQPEVNSVRRMWVVFPSGRIT